jgi:hypothetical protein
MNIIKLKKGKTQRLVYCLVDRLSLIQDNFTKEIIKNQSDFAISSLHEKLFDVYQGLDEDILLQAAASDGYEYAIVFSTGTEFLGNSFAEKANELFDKDFFLCGHVLDRKDAYYELHQQCYIINLKTYRQIGMPKIGEMELGVEHTQIEPNRSKENYHDDYTPIKVSTGQSLKKYNHKCHGWNILNIAFEKELKVLVFDHTFRNSKRHYYPENRTDFLKNLPWIYNRDYECAVNFVHTENTEGNRSLNSTEKFEQLVIPASGTLYHDLIDTGSVIIFDYNDKSLDYWKEHFPKKEGVTYSFVKADLLGEHTLIDYLDKDKKTFINLSNIFCYEGTASFKPLYYRLHKENEIINKLKEKNINVTLSFSTRAAAGFLDLPHVGDLSIIKAIEINSLRRPTWHINNDWK